MNIKVLTFEQIVKDKAKPPKPIIDDGILLENTILMIIGQHKTMKTFLALNMATAIASGKGFANFHINEKNRVMVLSAEGGYFPTKDRITKITKGISSKYLNNILMPKYINLKIDIDEDYESLNELIDIYKPNVLIIDPLIRFHTQDENSSSGMGKVFTRIREIIKYKNISIILIHHKGKDYSKGPRGSSVISGEYDSAIFIDKKANGIHNFQYDMRHVKTPEAQSMIFNNDTFWFEVDNKKSQNDIIRDIVKSNDTIEKNDLVDELMKSQEKSQSTVYKWIKRALEEKVIRIGKTDEIILN